MSLSLRSIVGDYLGVAGDCSLVRDVFPGRNAPGANRGLRARLEFVKQKGIIPHPFLTVNCMNMHEDSYASDTSTERGPATSTDIANFIYRTNFGEGSAEVGMFPTLAYDSKGRIVAIGARSADSRNIGWETEFKGWKEFTLHVLDPGTLEDVVEPIFVSKMTVREGAVTAIQLREKRQSINFDAAALYESTAGGAYFFLDNRDRAVIPVVNEESGGASRPEVWRVSTDTTPLRVEKFPLQGLGADDALVAVAPTWDFADHYWLATESGKVGVLNSVTGDLRLHATVDANEKIQNSMAVGPDGAFIASNRRIYCFRYDGNYITMAWPPKLYSRRAEGSDHQGRLTPFGTGTTPTLIGNRFVAICDDSFDMKVCVFDRQTGEEVDSQIAFPNSLNGRSGCENSVVTYKFSVIVGNTFGYLTPFDYRTVSQESNNSATTDEADKYPAPGLTRFDIDRTSGRMVMAWTNNIRVWTAVPKLSVPSQLLYIYGLDGEGQSKKWQVRGIDISNGQVKVAIPVASPTRVRWLKIEGPRGRDLREEYLDEFDNGWGPLYIGLNRWGGTSILVGMARGLIKVSVS